MPEGIVKWYNPGKGYGFIERSEGGSDIFVHFSALEQSGLDDLPEEQKVSFQIEKKGDRESAVEIKLLS